MSAPQRPISPLKVLRSAINKVVLVKLKDGSEYIGKLVMTDSTMNVVLVDCTEVREEDRTPVAKYGKVLIRGSHILYVSTDYMEAQLRT